MKRQGRRWKPTLIGASRQAAIEAVDAIADALQPAMESWGKRWDDPAGIDNASMACGRAGAALFFAYRAAALPQRDDAPAIDLIEEALNQLSQRAMDCSLYCGFTGLAWVCDQIASLSGNTSTEEDVNAEIDAALLEHVSRRRPDAEWDLIDGLTGIGVYGLNRLTRPNGRKIAEQVVEALAGLAQLQPDGLSWPTPERRHVGDDRTNRAQWSFNLGMAHGVPGAIAFLGAACVLDVAKATAGRLLEQAVPWLWNQRLEDDTLSCFPHFCGPGLDGSPSRCAWCYGDLGITSALMIAARGAERADWYDNAIKLARHCAVRRSDRRDVLDCGLCHGAGGVGHIFNRLYQASGDPLLEEASAYWLEWVLSKRDPACGIGGFRTWSQERTPDGEWIDDPRFLTGACGTGLALLAAATDRNPAWDTCLLLSIAGEDGA